MALSYFDPRLPAQQLRREMDRLLSGFLGGLPEPGWPFAARGRPAVNLWEGPESLFAELEIPGVKPDQVDVSVVGNELTIRVERPSEHEEGLTYHRRERPAEPFVRVVRLPSEVAADRVSAELRQGVLTITLPKSESARTRKIQVSSS